MLFQSHQSEKLSGYHSARLPSSSLHSWGPICARHQSNRGSLYSHFEKQVAQTTEVTYLGIFQSSSWLRSAFQKVCMQGDLQIADKDVQLLHETDGLLSII